MLDEPYQATMPAVAAGRAAVVARLRVLATRLDDLALDAAAEVPVLIEPALEAFERQAERALERAPVGAE